MVVVRDNAGENTSKELNDYFTERGTKNYFSAPDEQWQNGLAEASVISVEGCNYALVISDSFSEHRWQYGMKTRDEVLAMSKRWVAETADIQKDYPIFGYGP